MATMSCKNWEMMWCKNIWLWSSSLSLKDAVCSPISWLLGWLWLVEDLGLASLMVPICSYQTLLGLKTPSKEFETFRWSMMYYCSKLAGAVWLSFWMTCTHMFQQKTKACHWWSTLCGAVVEHLRWLKGNYCFAHFDGFVVLVWGDMFWENVM